MLLSKEEHLEAVGKFVYERTTTVIDGEENIRYTTYGIVAMDCDGKAVKAFQDVSTDRELVDEIVARCNAHQLDAIHLEDVLTDYLM